MVLRKIQKKHTQTNTQIFKEDIIAIKISGCSDKKKQPENPLESHKFVDSKINRRCGI